MARLRCTRGGSWQQQISCWTAPLSREDEEGGKGAHKPPRGAMCPGAGWMWMWMWMDPGADWDPGMKRQCGSAGGNTDQRTHVRARRQCVGDVGTPACSGLEEPAVEISQMDGAYEPPHSYHAPDAGKVRGDWKIDGGIRTDARVCFETGLRLRRWWGRRTVQDGRRSEPPRRRHVLEICCR